MLSLFGIDSIGKKIVGKKNGKLVEIFAELKYLLGIEDFDRLYPNEVFSFARAYQPRWVGRKLTGNNMTDKD